MSEALLFKRCRACFLPQGKAKFTSLFDDNLEEMLEKVAGISVRLFPL